MSNQTVKLPIDASYKVMQVPFAGLDSATLEETYDATISGSTSITLNTSTQFIEVTALLKGIFMKWGGTASSGDFDEFIAPESTRVYKVPINTTTGVLYTTVEFIEEAASAHLVVIEK